MRHRSLLFAIAFSIVIAACGGSSGGTAGPATTLANASTTTSIALATTTTAAPSRPFAVDRRDLVVEDTSHPTAAAPDRGLPEKPTRTLPLLVLAPKGAGPFPVVVFAHGVTGTGPAYEPALTPIAAAGYIVVAPTFPLSSGDSGTIFDYVNQPADMYFALDSIIQLGADASDPLYGRVDAEHVAFAGHSLGAMTTFGAVFNSCCADPRVDAAIVLSGVEAPFSGDYTVRPTTPLLLAHGDADTTIVVAGSERLYADATGPTAFLRFPADGHTGILEGDSGTLLDTTIIAWIDRWLVDDPSGWAAIPAAVEASGIANLTTKGM